MAKKFGPLELHEGQTRSPINLSPTLFLWNTNYVPQASSSVSTEVKQHGPEEGQRMVKNVLVLGSSFFLLYIVVGGIPIIQSYLHHEPSSSTLQWTSISFLLGLLTCVLIFSTIIVHHLTVKWTIVCGIVGQLLYVTVKAFPFPAILIPMGFVGGFSTTLLWTAKSVYLTHVGHEYAYLKSGRNVETLVIRFFAIFYFIFQIPSLLHYTINKYTQEGHWVNVGHDHHNRSVHCGSNYCQSTQLENMDRVNHKDSVGYAFGGIFIVCALASPVIIHFFLDPLTRYGERKDERKTSGILLSSFFRHIKNLQQILLIPLTLWLGMAQGFLAKDFMAGYVICSFGLSHAATALIAQGVISMLSSLSVSPLVRHFLDRGFGLKHHGRVVLTSFLILLSIALTVGLFFWKLDSEKSRGGILVFVALWGLADGVWMCELNSLHGVLFHKAEVTSAFSNYQLWKFLGSFIMSQISSVACVQMKLYILLGGLLVGILCYFLFERRISKETF